MTPLVWRTGNQPLARQVAAQALASSDDRDARIEAAWVFARAGDASQSQKLIEQLAKESLTNTLQNSVWLPVARATNLIRANQPGQAVDTLEATVPYELGAPPTGALYWPMYVRGEAYLHLRNGAKAAAEYQKILDHRGIAPNSPQYTVWPTLALPVPMRCRAIMPSQKRPTRTSWQSGRTPTPMSLS